MIRVGAVIVFHKDVTRDEASKLLQHLERIRTMGRAITHADVQEYEDHEGTQGPVFYIP